MQSNGKMRRYHPQDKAKYLLELLVLVNDLDAMLVLPGCRLVANSSKVAVHGAMDGASSR
jgi:hypothetical protein